MMENTQTEKRRRAQRSLRPEASIKAGPFRGMYTDTVSIMALWLVELTVTQGAELCPMFTP